MELEPRTTAPAHATGAVDFVPLADVDADATFRLRDEGDVSALAASIGRLGQLVPIELRPVPGLGPEDPPRWQVVAGFRRLAALRLLARERVLARVHAALDDDDAWAIALVQALLGEPLPPVELAALLERLPGIRSAGWAEELVELALERAHGAPAPAEEPDEDTSPVEVTPDELAAELAARLSEVNQDLALAFESWADLPEEGRRMILEQAEYVAALVPHLPRGGR